MQSRYLMRIGKVMSHIYIMQNITRNESKSQEIYIDKQSPQIRQIVYILVYFLKLSVQQGKKINIFKESIKSSINLSDEQDEIFYRKAMCVQ
ncbi:hypothetical protein pb186bvf_021012 [Paramecium bursaria]